MLVDVDNFTEAVSFLSGQRVLVVDTETHGLRPWHGDRIAGIAIMAGGKSFYFPFRHVNREGGGPWNLPLSYMNMLRPILSDPRREYWGFHYKFDLLMLHQDGFSLPVHVRDGQLSAHLLNENEHFPDNPKKPMFALKPLADKYIGTESSAAETRLAALLKSRGLSGKGDMWRLPPSDVTEYAETDVQLTAQLIRLHIPALKQWGLLDLWHEVNRYSIAVTAMEIRGIFVNEGLVSELQEQATEQAEKLRQRLEAEWKIANPRSVPQIRKSLDIVSTAEEVVDRLLHADPNNWRAPALKLLQDYRGWSGSISRQYEPYMEWRGDDHRIHCNIKLIGTISGRCSCANPNMQAVPAKTDRECLKRVKEIFNAEDDDYVLVNADYSQAELRMLGTYTKDARMKELFESGADFHAETGRDFNIDRADAKRINFGIVYGLGKRGLAEKTYRSQAEAQAILDKYHAGRPGIRVLSRAAQRTAEERRYIRLWTGRCRHFNTPYAETHKAMSNLIQGGVAEIVRVAITRLWDIFNGTEVRMLLQVHDSILFEVPRRRLGEIMPIIHTTMENFKDFYIPPKVDLEYGFSWGLPEKYKLKEVHA